MSLYSARVPGSGGERRRHRSTDERVASVGFLEQLHVAGQSAGVRQQHADRHDLAIAPLFLRAKRDKARQRLRDRFVQRKLATLVQQHRDRGRGHHLGQRGDVENRAGLDLGCIVLVGEAAECLQGNQFAAMRDCESGARKSALRNGFINQGKRARKLLVLIGRSGFSWAVHAAKRHRNL